MRALLMATIALAAAVSAVTVSAPEWIQGRWAMNGAPLAYNFVGDSIEAMIIPLQGPLLSYRLNGKTLEVNAEGKAAPSAEVEMRRDTLILTLAGRPMRFTRIGTAKWDSTSIAGSWRGSGPTSTVLTLRSDGILISESGHRSDANYRGDTLDIAIVPGTVRRHVFRRSSDTLFLRWIGGGNEQVLLRRPWGCFGMPAVNRAAKECG